MTFLVLSCGKYVTLVICIIRTETIWRYNNWSSTCDHQNGHCRHSVTLWSNWDQFPLSRFWLELIKVLFYLIVHSHLACEEERLDEAKLLVERGANLQLQNKVRISTRFFKRFTQKVLCQIRVEKLYQICPGTCMHRTSTIQDVMVIYQIKIVGCTSLLVVHGLISSSPESIFWDAELGYTHTQKNTLTVI